tara:strand:- start:90 stop:704 length:615 start_codon:yes stop_codon:yes gene_type:complete
LYKENACKPYREALSAVDISIDKIPQFREINKALAPYDFRVFPVEGLISTRRFMQELSDGTMLCTRYIRHHSHPYYTPEPDIIHEVMGHCVFFADEKYRKLNRAFGKAARKANDVVLEKIAQLYWYTVEFGICTEDNKPKAFGAGLLSSVQELTNMKSVKTDQLDFDVIMRTSYDTMNPHTKLYRSPDSFYDTTVKIIDFLSQI